MILIGELINSSRQPVAEAIAAKDVKYIQNLAQAQAAAGVHYIDVNCGTRLADESQVLVWLTQIIQEVVDLPLCLDSPNPEALSKALQVHRGKALLNSISLEQQRYEQMLPIVLEYGCSVIGLCMDDEGMPETVADTVRCAELLVERLLQRGVPMEDLYLDPLVRPLSTNHQAATTFLGAVAALRDRFPTVHLTCGLSNISYGLPKRRILNQAFLVAAMAAGLDSAILDPLDRNLMALVCATEAILGKDPYCAGYLAAHRAGMLEHKET
ncbi:MAG TPA: methyltetrahydrofolate cobalamin methyltransferase [Firmicutes bacterium]|nr:methyltetrahydrofolate cobalamin methyltransferase [Bacillota bacterium]